MRIISVKPGVFNTVSYTYRQPGSSPFINLVCKQNKAKPPKSNYVSGTGTGDRGWLVNTPFLTVDMTNESEEDYKVLFGIDSSAAIADIEAQVLNNILDYTIIPVSEEDAAFIAKNMKMPLLIVTDNKNDGNLVAIFRRFESDSYDI